jgi:hypothetical protein
MNFFSPIFICGTVFWTQGIMLVRHMFFHLSHTPSPIWFCNEFTPPNEKNWFVGHRRVTHYLVLIFKNQRRKETGRKISSAVYRSVWPNNLKARQCLLSKNYVFSIGVSRIYFRYIFFLKLSKVLALTFKKIIMNGLPHSWKWF